MEGLKVVFMAIGVFLSTNSANGIRPGNIQHIDPTPLIRALLLGRFGPGVCLDGASATNPCDSNAQCGPYEECAAVTYFGSNLFSLKGCCTGTCNSGADFGPACSGDTCADNLNCEIASGESTGFCCPGLCMNDGIQGADCSVASDCGDTALYTCETGRCCPETCPVSAYPAQQEVDDTVPACTTFNDCADGYYCTPAGMCCKRPACQTAVHDNLLCSDSSTCETGDSCFIESGDSTGHCCPSALIGESCTATEQCSGSNTMCGSDYTCQCVTERFRSTTDGTDCYPGACPVFAPCTFPFPSSFFPSLLTDDPFNLYCDSYTECDSNELCCYLQQCSYRKSCTANIG